MPGREAVAKALSRMPAGLVQWGAIPVEVPRLSTGMAGLDRALNGGWPVGRLCSLAGQGRTSIVGAGVAEVTATGGLVGWIDGDGSLDVKALDQAGADLSRVLWVRGPLTWPNMMAAAEAVTQTDGFEMVIVRPPNSFGRDQSWWFRLAREAEKARTTVVALDNTPHASVKVQIGSANALWEGIAGPGQLLTGAKVELGGQELDVWAFEALAFGGDGAGTGGRDRGQGQEAGTGDRGQGQGGRDRDRAGAG